MSEIDKIVDPRTRAALSAQAATVIQQAIERQGLFALANPFHDAAVHEGGHALMYAMAGRRVEYVQLFEASPFRRRRELESARKMARRNGKSLDHPLLSSATLKVPAWCGHCSPEGGEGYRTVYHPKDTDEQARQYLLDVIAGFAAESLIELESGQRKPLGSSIDEIIVRK